MPLIPSCPEGLDPAASQFANTDPVVRLDHTDADLVDVYHTDANPVREY